MVSAFPLFFGLALCIRAEHSEALYWTNVFKSMVATNWAGWSWPTPGACAYSFEICIDQEHGRHKAVRSTVHIRTSTSLIHLNQPAASGWPQLELVLLTNHDTAPVVVGENSPVAG